MFRYIYSLVVVYDNLFKILSILYNSKNLHKDVLNQIKDNCKYYKTVANNYLRLQKLELVDLLAGMLTKDLPADEICIHACGVFLQLHITVDFHSSILTTLDIPNVQQDLAIILSDIHLAYRGSCKYNLLCRNVELKPRPGCYLIIKYRTIFNRRNYK